MNDDSTGRGFLAALWLRARSIAKCIATIYGKIGHRLIGGFVILVGLGLAAWGIFGEQGLLSGRVDVPLVVLWLSIASMLLVAGTLTALKRDPDSGTEPAHVVCAGCESQRPYVPGDVCPQCGSARRSVAWLNRAALALVAFFFGAPPLGFVCIVVVDWLAGAEPVDVISRRPLGVIVGLTLSLFLAASSGSAAWQGRLPGWTSRLLSSHMNHELEKVLSSRIYAIALVLVCLIAVAAVTIILVV